MTSAQFVVGLEDSAAFARLSGDFNPMHLDDLAARRLQFGGTVCHGVHLVLQALEALACGGELQGQSLEALSAVFHHPVHSGVRVQLGITSDAARPRIKVAGWVEGAVQFTTLVTLRPIDPAPAVAESEPESVSAALSPAFPVETAAQQALAGEVPLRVNAELFVRLFPALAAWPEGRAVAADLMASTCIVGMRCPGLNSIYGEFKLQRRAVPTSAATMRFGVTRVDPRFKKVRVTLQGALLEGLVDAFFRAPPVAQRSLAEVSALTRSGCVAGQRALVVGGSRGLGELVAKMLLAGGAEVTVTYTRGQADAARTMEQASERQALCHSLQLDAAGPLPPRTVAALTQAAFTHVYYFATPAIRRSTSGAWSQAVFENYCRVYLTGLAEVAHAAAAGRRGDGPLNLFYPSTAFLDDPERGFAEYCAAKAAAEALCDHLALDGARFAVQHPRLPRMKTDQTTSFLGPEADDPFPIMARMLREFCGWQPVQ